MSELDRAPQPTPESPVTSEYVPPQVESVLLAEELAREVHYAGDLSNPG